MNNTYKIALIIFILILVIFLDICFRRSIDKTIDGMIQELSDLKTVLLEENYEKGKNKSEEINESWGTEERKVAFVIEHDELEKVSSKMNIIVENINNKNYTFALEDIIETKYILEHIKDKNKLSLKNIF